MYGCTLLYKYHDPFCRRVILENGERIAALGALREAENRLLSARPRPGRGPPPGLALLQAAIAHAGRACAPEVPLSLAC